MKPGRQKIILDIISEQEIETQFDLMRALADKGVKSTQATLSRDIKDMNLVKEVGANGKAHYVVSKEAINKGTESRLQTILKQSVLGVDIAQNILVLKTLPGLASAACSSIDKMKIPGLVGTIAGDDTAFIAMKDLESSEIFFEEIKKLI